jgi:TP901 family phage tail tape measure protein
MSGRDMKVSVLVQLIDRLTGPLRGITAGVTATANRVGELGRKIGLVGAALTALSFSGPIQAAAAWDSQLRDIAITAGKTGGEVEKMIAATSAQYHKLAVETGQASADLAKGAQLLVASGMDAGLIDKLMPTIGKVATAAGASVEDTAKTVFALSETLKVPADQMEEMLGKLITAGKLGRFEFKNMASEFPALTNQMAKFGITGAEAVETLGASLQIAMLGTANPAEAANNLKNFLTKINAPEAIKKFEKELKVDVTGVMTDAAAKGINPVEAVIQKMADKLKVPTAEIDKIMKKAGASNMSDKEKEATIRKQVAQLVAGSKVGKLYSDMQVLDFLIPTLLNLDKLKEFKRQVKEAGVGVIAEDFASRMRGLEPQMKIFSDLGTQVARRIGLAFASNIPRANEWMIRLLQTIQAIDAKWPGLIDKTLTWGSSLLMLGAALALLTPVVSALGAALALLLSPIGLILIGLAALAAAAAYIYSNWSSIAPQLGALWNSIAVGFEAGWASIKSGRALQAAIDWVTTKVAELGPAVLAALPGMIESGGKLVAAIGEGIATALVTVAVFGISIVAAIAAAIISNVDVMTQAGARLIGTLTEAAEKKFWEFVEWCKGLPGRIAAAIGEIDLSNIVKWPSMPAWMGGSKGAPVPGTPGGAAVDPMGGVGGFNPTSAPGSGIGGSNGFTRTSGSDLRPANSNVQVGGVITVQAADGTRIVNVQSENPAVPIAPNRGTMLGRA